MELIRVRKDYAGAAPLASPPASRSAALIEAYNELIPEFERGTQNKVVTSFGGDDIPRRIEGGEPGDLVIIWRAHLDKLVKQRIVVPGSEMDLVRSSIGVAVRDRTSETGYQHR